MFKRILVAIDASDYARHAVPAVLVNRLPEQVKEKQAAPVFATPMQATV